MVAGGGGGGSNVGGGGGAGGVLQGIAQITSGATYTITVGSGGTGGTTSVSGQNGVNSTISGTGVSVTSVGGGGGGNGYWAQTYGSNGGSGGGGGNYGGDAIGGTGTLGQGYGGGKGNGASPYSGGGGGGYGMYGANYNGSYAGNGGDGFTTYIANPATYSWSNYFNGSSYFTVGNTATNFLCTGSSSGITATFEAWVYPTAYNTGPYGHTFSSISAKDGTYFNFGVYNGYLRFYWYDGGPKYVQSVNSTDVPLNTWTYVTMTINGSTIKMYINGVLNTTSATYTGISSAGSGTSDEIGREDNGPTYFTGYISNYRLTNTVVYTSNFTPSTTPLTAITGTALLTCQSPTFVDNSTNNYTITNTGGTYIASQNPFGASYAGGGGGAVVASSGGIIGQGGMGGGGAGAGSGNGINGGTNTGGGGGSNYGSTGNGLGGSGVVILAYPSTFPTAASTTGSPTVTTTGGYRVYTFTGGGTITF